MIFRVERLGGTEENILQRKLRFLRKIFLRVSIQFKGLFGRETQFLGLVGK
jgi:hypothetical protein